MKKLIVSFLTFVSLQIVYSQSGWFLQQSGTTQSIRSVFFLNANTGYLGVAMPGWQTITGRIVRTTDGGQNWTTIYSSGSGGPGFYQIYFLNEITGFAIGSTSGSGVFLKTTDGGVTWAVVIYNFNCSEFHFINSLTAFACGGSYIKKTTDGGNNWSYLVIPGVQLYSIYFPNSQTGYAAGNQSYEVHPAICKTTDGGISWSDTILTNYENHIYSICFINGSTGYFVGGQNENYYPLDCIILKTTNFGISFTRQLSGMASNLYATTFINQNTGFAVGGKAPYQGNLIIKTTNGGNNWFTQQTPSSSTLYSVFFIDSLTGYAAGVSGTIYKTTSGGVIGIKNIDNYIPTDFFLHQNYPNPFNPNTSIKFDIPTSPRGEGQVVRLIIYDHLGREVATIINEPLKPGTYEVEFDGNAFASGVYFYTLITSEFTQTKKLILLK